MRKKINYGMEITLMGVPAVAIVADVSLPSKLQDGDGEDFWTAHTIWASFENKKLYEYDTGRTTQKQWAKRRKLIEKDGSDNSCSVKDEYQLPFSETGYRSSIFDVGHREKITKANLKKWLVGKAYAELNIEPEQSNQWAFAGIKNPVIAGKEIKINEKV